MKVVKYGAHQTIEKYSRRNGTIVLHSYASGNGAISFVWVNTCSGEASGQPVTESDISEYLEIPENAERWRDWVIVPVNDHLYPVLAKAIRRRGERRLEIPEGNGKGCSGLYRYEHPAQEDPAPHNTTYRFKRDREWHELKNLSAIAAMNFFLSHEAEVTKAISGV